MRTSSRAEVRQGALDGVLLAAGPVGEQVAADLFGVVDLLDATPQLRRALTDPNVDGQSRRGLATRLLAGKVEAVALDVVEAAVEQAWSSGRALASALERQGVRACLWHAEQAGRLDDVEETLFRFGRVVDADHELRTALGNSTAPLAARRELVTTLLAGRAPAETVTLAERAGAARNRTLEVVLQNSLTLAAARGGRVVATVRVAAPLTPDQEARLRDALTRQASRVVNLHVVVDPGVVGGIMVEMGDEVIDGTVAGRLADARRHLA